MIMMKVAVLTVMSVIVIVIVAVVAVVIAGASSRSFLIEVVLFFQSRESFVWITPVLAGGAFTFIVIACLKLIAATSIA